MRIYEQGKIDCEAIMILVQRALERGAKTDRELAIELKKSLEKLGIRIRSIFCAKEGKEYKVKIAAQECRYRAKEVVEMLRANREGKTAEAEAGSVSSFFGDYLA